MFPPVPLPALRRRLPWRHLFQACAFVFAAALNGHAAGTRINQEGRILGPAPTVSGPVLFNTARADAVVAAMQVMPVDSPWNEDVSRRPLLANSDAMIAQIKTDLGPSRQTLRAFYEMNYVLVPDGQPPVPITFFNYPDESDPGPYPLPGNLPVEGWPRGTGNLTLLQWQQNINGDGGDRHAIVVQPGIGSLWETWLTQLTGTGWQASNGAKFDLDSNALRPAGWTSGDAAGLPMFPALVRYDECERGMVEHALRLVVKRTRVGPIYPAVHQASVGNTTDPNIPAMGQRVRLKAGFVIPEGWTREEKAVLLALRKYGALVADNGGFFSVSVCPDDRFAGNAFDDLSTVGIDNFEIVQATGAAEGPRSAGAPVASAGGDFTVTANVSAVLNGTVTAPAGTALAVAWKTYAGPGTVTFDDAAQAASRATFSTPGTYTLELSAADGIHAVAYDAATVTVAAPGTAAAVPTVTLSIAGDATVARGQGVARIVCRRAAGDIGGALVVFYRVRGTARPGVDYQPLGGTVTIPAGAGQTRIKIRPIPGPAADGTRTVKLSLLPSTDGVYLLGTGTRARVRIVDPS